MNCPKCGTRLGFTHAYQMGVGSKTQRAECPKCFTVCTTVTITTIVAIDPKYGEGAGVLALKIVKDNKGIELQKGIESIMLNKKAPVVGRRISGTITHRGKG